MTHCDVDDTFLTPQEMLSAVESYGSPLFVYDEQRLRHRAKSLLSLFSPCHKQYFPLRYCTLDPVLSVVRQAGIGAQCQTETELRTALSAGFSGEDILYCAMTMTPCLANELCTMNAALMAGSTLALQQDLPSRVYLMCRLPKKRNCPGVAEMERCGVGFLPDELPPVIRMLREKGVETVGLALRHEGNISNEQFLGSRVQAMHLLSERLRTGGTPVDAIHIDGSLGVQYNRVKLHPMNEEAAASSFHEAAAEMEEKISLSLGLFLLEPCAIFLTTIVDVWKRSCPVIVLDGLLNMLRLGAVERYHHISVLERPWIEQRTVCDVYGNLPVAGEWFAKNRVLPLPEKGEHVVLHDVGCTAIAHCGIPVLWHGADGSMTVLQNGKE